ncbi:MAG: acetate--CoA ligase family protein [Gemmatimonadota bacterium]
MLDSLLRPRSIAVIGASRSPGSIGYDVLDNLLCHRFTGPVYPVNPNADSVHSVPAYPSVRSLPEAPELAVIVVPKERVLDVARDCAAAGVRALVVISAGFRETGPDGARREAELLDLVRREGMRLVGPNCMGVINTAPSVSMNATFAPTMPPRGGIAFMSQSGAMGVTILDYAAEYGIGISQFVSIGNKADVSGNDLLAYWGEDGDVRVILMYLEAFGNPRRFTRLARRTTRRKPVIVVKAGRSGAGARAASSHTGALAAVDIATDALFAQCGVQRVDTVEGLFEAAIAFGNAPLPAGPRVAILTNAGGPGIIIADACEGVGLDVAPLSAEAQARLREGLPAEASVSNPVDMIASATPSDFRRALEIVLADPEVDAVVAAYVPVGFRAPEVAREIRGVAKDSDKPVLAVLMGRKGLPQGMAELREARIPGYIFPESAARALGSMYRYRRWLERPAGIVREFEVDAGRVDAILTTALADGREYLALVETFEVLRCYGIPAVESRHAEDAEGAVAMAAAVGYPVALKAAAPAILHKTESGAVKLGLRTDDEVREAFREIRSAVSGKPVASPEGGRPVPSSRRREGFGGVLVQRMIRGGRETIVGMVLEANFGPLVMFGLGGIYVEVLRDVTFRVQPVSDVDAGEMVRSLRGYPLLVGVRGEAGVDLEFLAEVIQRVSQLVGRHPQIRELDINPFLAFPEAARCLAVDARIRVAA